MDIDSGLRDALVGKQAHCRDAVPVYRLREQRTDDLERRAIEAGQRFARAAGLGPLRFEVRRGSDHTIVTLQEGITACVFHASGAFALERGWGPLEHLLSEKDDVDGAALEKRAEAAIHELQLAPAGHDDELRFERLWRLKATGVTRQGERGPVVLTRAVAAFRRFVSGLPVYGRASVYAALANDGVVASAGVDWRPIADMIAHTRVLSPEEAAHRILGELQSFVPGGRVTPEHYVPEQLSLGYFSLPRRRPQAILQPAYVATFTPRGQFPSLGRLIVVPASSTPFEPLCRPLGAPPWTTRKATQPSPCAAR